MTYKLDLEEQDYSTHLGDSCVYSIVDGDVLKIEPVNVTNKVPTDANKSTMNESTNEVQSLNFADDQKLEVITNKLNGNSKSYQGSKSNSVSI